MILSSGEQASADLTVLSGEVMVDESMLTGESDYIVKKTGDTVLSGSAVMVGEARARADAVGDDTYAAKLSARVMGAGRHKSELMATIMKIIKFLTVMLSIVAVTVVITMIYKIAVHGDDPSLWGGTTLSLDDPVAWVRIFLTAGTFCVGIIPTGLVLTTSVTLLLSIVSLSKQETLIQELYSLENLSRVDVICLDKTGTLTDGTMDVCDVRGFDTPYDKVVGCVRDLMAVTENRNQTADALFRKFGKSDVPPEVSEIISFSSEKKYSGVIYADGTELLIGAPEYLLPKDSGHLDYVSERASEGKRVIVMTENGLLIAFFIMEDHIRDTARDTIRFFRSNNVTAKIISGDNPLTVSKIAEMCGVENADKAISLENVPLSEIPSVAEDYTVFARVSPEQKEALVGALQNNRHKVAMTGDGVNDILALRKSDLSITFAKATEAAKSCSDVVLLDNDFSHLKEVVAEGRRVIGNVQKTAILFLMKSLAIIICAFAMIPFARGQMWFSIENAYLLEASIIGTGGFLLSLEYQRDPLRGTFIKNIALKALASGLLAATAIMLPVIMYTAPSFTGFDPLISSTNVGAMITILLALAGFVVVLSMCVPFNKYRIFTIIAVLIVGTFLGMALPTSYIGGTTTGIGMFAFDADAGQTILDSQFFHELFQPWNSPVIQSISKNPDNFILMRIFVFVAIPIFFIVMNLIDRYLYSDYGLKNTERTRISIGKMLLLVSGVVLIIQRIIAIVTQIWDLRNVTLPQAGEISEVFIPIAAVITVAFPFILSGLYIFQGYSGYRVWKNGDRRFMRISFVFAIVSLVLLTTDIATAHENFLRGETSLATIDNVISIIITLLYITGGMLVWFSRPKPQKQTGNTAKH